MRVLMFGWEFPPFNSGGLGTACYGLTKALSEKGVEINFALPKNLEISEDFLNVISTNLPKVKIKEVNSLLVSYATSYSYKKRFSLIHKNANSNYCCDLLQEVYRYSLLAKDIASRVEHDLIHAHDWMTFPAGLEARKVSGKPLIAHVHSTEFDRCGGHCVNPAVFEVEKEGIQEANQVIAVSGFTKNKVLESYAIDFVVTNVQNPALEKIKSYELKFEKSLKDENLRGLFTYNRLFHGTIFETCNNNVVSEMIDQLRKRSHIWYNYFAGNPQHRKNSVKEHNLMIECLQKRDTAQLKSVNKKHLTRGYKNYKEDLRTI